MENNKELTGEQFKQQVDWAVDYAVQEAWNDRLNDGTPIDESVIIDRATYYTFNVIFLDKATTMTLNTPISVDKDTRNSVKAYIKRKVKKALD